MLLLAVGCRRRRTVISTLLLAILATLRRRPTVALLPVLALRRSTVTLLRWRATILTWRRRSAVASLTTCSLLILGVVGRIDCAEEQFNYLKRSAVRILLYSNGHTQRSGVNSTGGLALIISSDSVS